VKEKPEEMMMLFLVLRGWALVKPNTLF